MAELELCRHNDIPKEMKFVYFMLFCYSENSSKLMQTLIFFKSINSVFRISLKLSWSSGKYQRYKNIIENIYEMKACLCMIK